MTIWMDREPGLDCGEFSTRMESDLPVVAERSVYFGYAGEKGGTAAEGAKAPGQEWHFAEGFTGGEFDTYFLLSNPNGEAAEVTLTFMLPDASEQEAKVVLPAFSRGTVNVDSLPGLEQAEFSTTVGSSMPIVAERAMYFKYAGRGGGHDAMGVAQPSGTWYFAEGFTAGDFDTYILLQNPSPSSAEVSLTFMLTGGGEVKKNVTIEPYARYTLHADAVPGLEQAEFSTLVESATPLVAERAMYFVYNTRDGGSCSQGTTSPALEWYFAEGYTGS
jgi:hypothetical protein